MITTEAGIYHHWLQDFYIVLGNQKDNKAAALALLTFKLTYDINDFNIKTKVLDCKSKDEIVKIIENWENNYLLNGEKVKLFFTR